MSTHPAPRFAARLNSFRVREREYWPGRNGKATTLDLVERAARVRGLNCVDLNYPDHLVTYDERQLIDAMGALGVSLNGYAMRYYDNEGFKLGAFTHPDAKIRREAIDLTKRGIDSLSAAGGRLMTLWMGQDGFDYSFQADYRRLWDQTLDAIREIAEHNRAIDVSIEYKPNEPRSFSLMPNVTSTLLAIREIGRPNLGVTLDFAHVLYADEMPAYAAALVARNSRLLGVHLNDGYAKRDDGLMVGAVHPIQTLELFYVLKQVGYDGAIYFDTFPDTTGLDPIAECEANIATVAALRAAAARLENDEALRRAIDNQDAVAALPIVRRALYGV
ncbi:MAG: TIM barrel protein [Pseudomonadota bacterium]|nr:TIM barrel protein [Pseudomonadota bacterium]